MIFVMVSAEYVGVDSNTNNTDNDNESRPDLKSLYLTVSAHVWRIYTYRDILPYYWTVSVAVTPLHPYDAQRWRLYRVSCLQ